MKNNTKYAHKSNVKQTDINKILDEKRKIYDQILTLLENQVKNKK